MKKRISSMLGRQDGVAIIFVIFILIVIGALGAALRNVYINEGNSVSLPNKQGNNRSVQQSCIDLGNCPGGTGTGSSVSSGTATGTNVSSCTGPNCTQTQVPPNQTCTNNAGTPVYDKDHGVGRVHHNDDDDGQTWGGDTGRSWDSNGRSSSQFVRFDAPDFPGNYSNHDHKAYCSNASFGNRTDNDGDHHKGDFDDDSNFRHHPFSSYGNLTVTSNAGVAFDGPTGPNGQCLGVDHYLTVYVNGDLTVSQGATITTTCNVRIVVTGNTNFNNNTSLVISSGTVLLITGCFDAGGNRTCGNSNNNSNNNTSFINAGGDSSNLMIITTGDFNVGDNDALYGGVYSNGKAYATSNSAINGSFVGVGNDNDGRGNSHDWGGWHGDHWDNGNSRGFVHVHSAGSRAWANTSSCSPPPPCSYTRTGVDNDGGHHGNNNGNGWAWGNWENNGNGNGNGHDH